MTTETQTEAEDAGSDAEASSPVRYPTAIALGGGLAAAVGSSFIPMNAIEGFVSAYGIAELLPAAAPPLGNTARLALSTGIGTLTAGALLALLPRGETDDMGYETAVTDNAASGSASDEQATAATGFGATKLAGWLKTLRFGKTDPAEDHVSDFGELSRLRVRMGDQHPDAPARTPIMASSDLGAPLDVMPAADVTEAPPLALDSEMAVAQPEPFVPPPSMRFAPPADAPIAAEVLATPSEPFIEDVEDVAAEIATDSNDLTELDIAELLDRLESGLERRRAQASAMASDAGDAVPERRVVPLTLAAAPAEPEVPASPMRFNLGEPSIAPSVDAVAQAAEDEPVFLTADATLWEDAADYLPPALPTTVSGDDDIGSVVPEAQAAQAEPGIEADAPVADDDMDAALRDALATLRQLSDRQRNL